LEVGFAIVALLCAAAAVDTISDTNSIPNNTIFDFLFIYSSPYSPSYSLYIRSLSHPKYILKTKCCASIRLAFMLRPLARNVMGAIYLCHEHHINTMAIMTEGRTLIKIVLINHHANISELI
jgi:hypothetical protein